MKSTTYKNETQFDSVFEENVLSHSKESVQLKKSISTKWF
jgi:hypothetical protein